MVKVVISEVRVAVDVVSTSPPGVVVTSRIILDRAVDIWLEAGAEAELVEIIVSLLVEMD